MNRLLLKLPLSLIAACVALAGAPALRGAHTEPSQPLMVVERNDTLGHGWEVVQNGCLGADSQGCFQQALMLTVNNMQLNFNKQLMTPDGGEYVFSGATVNMVQGLEVTRRIKIDFKQGYALFLESFRSTGKSPVGVNFNLHTRMSGQCASIITDQRSNIGGALGPKDNGFVCLPQQPGMITPAFYLGNPKAKVRPSIQNQANFNLNVHYTLTVPAGKTVSVLHGIAQRNLTNMSPDAKELAAIFKPFQEDRWLQGLPAEVRSSVINAPSAAAGLGEFTEIPDLIAGLGPRSQHDMLLLGESTRLRGTVVCPQFTIATARGEQKLPLDKVAAILGDKQSGGAVRLVLRDGQMFVGPLAPAQLKFTLNSGLDASCDLARLDRLVLREQPADGQPGPDVFAYIDLPTGDRLAIAHSEQQKISVQTIWGTLEIPLGDIQQWAITGKSQGLPGHHFVLKDGSAFSGFLADTRLKLVTTHHGVQEFSSLDIPRLRSAQARTDKSERTVLNAPHVILTGDNVFVGQTELSVLHLETGGQVIPVAPPQIKLLRRKDPDSGGQGALFQAELWDGDLVTGTIREAELPVRAAGTLLAVSPTDVVELRVPTPTVPESLRSRIQELIAALGDEQWTRREAATKELAGLGPIAVEQFQEALKQATDQEVRKRIQALLEAAKD